VKQFNVGQSNPTFLVIDGRGRKVVVRKKPTGKLIATAHMIEREFKILKALKTIDFPVPEVYTFCQSDDVLGTPFYVIQKFGKKKIKEKEKKTKLIIFLKKIR